MALVKSPFKALSRSLVKTISGAGDGKWSRRFAALARFREKLARSSRVFLLCLLGACAVEVVLDWNSTILEINSLRAEMRDRGTSYAAILDKSAAAPIVGRDIKTIEDLSAGVFDDEDAVFVRYADADGRVVFERIDQAYGEKFRARKGKPFTEYYAHQLERDVGGMLHDPEGLRYRMTTSRHRDFIQAWNDIENRVFSPFSEPKIERPHTSSIVMYQDRLYTEKREHDPDVTYSLATVVAPGTDKAVGVLVVAFSMDRTNGIIRSKILKGLGLILLFVALLVLQNVSSRRDKLRLLEHDARQRFAKEAIAAALPEALTSGALRVAGALDQTQTGVDGLIWDYRVTDDFTEVVLIDPVGNDAVTAAVALHAIQTYRKLAKEMSVAEVLAALADAAHGVPLTHPIGALVVRIAPSGDVDGAGAKMGGFGVVKGSALTWGPEDESLAHAGLQGPLCRLTGTLDEGAALVLVCDGIEERATRLDPAEVVDFVGRDLQDVGKAVSGAIAWVRGKWPATKSHDLAIVAISRVPA